jgi:LuxR family maltose regulon positive regulatory protein
LDEADNNPPRFWSYVIAALQTIQADIGAASLAALQDPQPQPLQIEALLTSLINQVAALDSLSLFLVLDDLHVITAPQISEGVAFLLDHLPPQMRLILSTRADPPWPLARLRARGEMIELRTEDLRFTRDEVVAFCDAMELELTTGDIAALDARTEGWVAGLQMAALSMRGRADTATFVQGFSGSHRFVLDYLVEEVLDQQPGNIQEFLLKTSVLDRLSAPLCDAVLANPASIGQDACDLPSVLERSSSSQAILEHLEQANVFLIPLDDERHWYRYHHLFAELLRNRLEQSQPDQVPVLRRQASEWCERARLIDEAISYALAARLYERAADLVQHYASEAARHGAYLSLHHWLESLPEDIIRSRPRLCIWYGGTSMYHSLEAAEGWAEAGERALAARAGEADGHGASDLIWVDLLNLRANIAYVRGDGPQVVLCLVEQARALLPEGQALPHSLVMRLAETYKDLGEDEASDRAYGQAQQLAEARDHYAIALHAVCGRVLIARRYGRLPQAVALCRQALRSIAGPVERSGGRLPVAGLVHILLGRILLEWNELEQAKETLSRGLTLSEPLWDHVIRSMGRAALARTMLAQGHVDELSDLGDSGEQTWSAFTDYVAALRAWIVWMRASRAPGGLGSAPEWAQVVQWANGRRLRLAYQDIHIRPQFLQIRLRIAQYREYGQPRLEPVLDYVKEQFQFLQERGWTELMIDASIVQAMALQAQGKRERALRALERALMLAKPGRWVRIFVDEGPPMAELLKEATARGIERVYANKLLAALSADRKEMQKTNLPAPYPVAGPSSTLVEPLSERELEVLRLLLTDLTSTEIAQELYISKNTVRSHIGHIYDKLGVHSRADAVQGAEELGLL